MEKVKSVLEYYFDCPVRAVYVSDAGDVSQLGKYREQISVYASSHIHKGVLYSWTGEGAGENGL